MRMYARKGSGHRRNVARLETMRATGSLGWVSDVALALIEQAGRNPIEVFREELDAALHGGRHAHFGCDGYFGALFCHYGVLSPFLTFGEGDYNDGTLGSRSEQIETNIVVKLRDKHDEGALSQAQAREGASRLALGLALTRAGRSRPARRGSRPVTRTSCSIPRPYCLTGGRRRSRPCSGCR